MSSAAPLAPLADFALWPYLRWISNHLPQVPSLLADLQEIKAAPTLREKWDPHTKHAGDTLVGMLDDFPTAAAASIDFGATVSQLDVQELGGRFVAAGVDWSKLLDLLPQIVALARLLQEVLAAVA